MENANLTQHNEDNFKKMLLVSFGLHIFVVLFFSIKTVFFPSDIPKYLPSIRVDLVALPDKRTEQAPLAPKTAKEEVAHISKKESTKTSTKEKDVKKEQSDALNKLKTMSALDKIKNMKETKEKGVEQKKEIVKGNVLSAGSSLTGLNKIEFNQYIGDLDARVKSHWALPEWMASLNLRAEISIKIDKTGQIIEKTFLLKSGNSDFDNYVLSAIDQSNPFPPPPEKFIDLVGIRGITFAFPN